MENLPICYVVANMEPLTALKPKNIIIRFPNWIGDLVMATPIISDLRRYYPDAYITVMCRSSICELLKEDPEIDELFCFSKVSPFSRHSEKRNIVEKLRKGKYDLGILLTNSLSSAWWFWQGKVARRLGFTGDGRRLLLTDRVAAPKDLERHHLVMTYKKLLEPLGIPLSETRPRLFVTDKEKELVEALLRKYGVKEGAKIVGVNPGAAFGSAKCWLPERFREVTERLLQDPELFVVYFGDVTGAPLVKEICNGLSPRVINLAGLTSLRELAALLTCCNVLLTNDSGPMHIADALGVPVVALFGSTNAIATGPYRSGKVIQKHVSCSPCYKRTCPIDFRCMKQITVEEVLEAVQGALKHD